MDLWNNPNGPHCFFLLYTIIMNSSIDKTVDPDVSLQKSITMVKTITTGNQPLSMIFESIVSRLTDLLHTTTKKGMSEDNLKRYKLEQSVAIDHLIIQKLNRQIHRNEAQDGGFIYGAVSKTTTSVAKYGVGILISAIASSTFGAYRYFSNNLTKNFLKEIARANLNKISKFTAVAILAGQTRDIEIVQRLNKTHITPNGFVIIDRTIDRLRLKSSDLSYFEMLHMILVAGYLYTATKHDTLLVFDKTSFKKCLYMCLGFGVSSEIVAAREAFELKYVVDGLMENIEKLEIIPSTHYGVILSNLIEELRIIRSHWYDSMLTSIQENFDWVESSLLRSEKTIHQELTERAISLQKNFIRK